jgi:hypothetical protein
MHPLASRSLHSLTHKTLRKDFSIVSQVVFQSILGKGVLRGLTQQRVRVWCTHVRRIIERNNRSMVAWTAKAPFNPLAHDLLRIVEVFADDSNFKSGVINSSAEALAIVLQVLACVQSSTLSHLLFSTLASSSLFRCVCIHAHRCACVIFSWARV